MKIRGKKGLGIEMIGLLLILAALLVLAVIALYLLKGKGSSLIETIKNIFRFGAG